jgi:chloramphenicol O-acetyltransferase
MRLAFALAVLFALAACASDYEMRLRMRVLEERMNLLDAKVDTALKAK